MVTPAIICIDVEPDGKNIDPHHPAPWKGFEGLQDPIERFRAEIPTHGGRPRFAWFVRMDPQVEQVYGSPHWAGEKYAHYFRHLFDSGDEVGLHIHPWRWLSPESGWMQDFQDQTWVSHCVDSSVEAFRNAFGHSCKSVRFGERWLNRRTLDLLEKKGIRFDLTVEPGPEHWGLPAEGGIRWTFPDYRKAPRVPFHPSINDIFRPGRKGARPLWMIPVSTSAGVTPPRELPEGNGGGLLRIEPNPILMGTHADRAVATISWEVEGTRRVDVRINAPNGVLFCGGNARGSATTGNWVVDGTTFFLQDADARNSSSAENTIAVARASVIAKRDGRSIWRRIRSFLMGSPPVGVWHSLDLSLEPPEFQRRAHSLLEDPTTVHLTTVLRSDAGSQPVLRTFIEENLRFLAVGQSLRQIEFVTPERAVEILSNDTQA